jgi:hypothetical protein
VIGDGLRSRIDERRMTEVNVAVDVLNRMRIWDARTMSASSDSKRGWGGCLKTVYPCTTLAAGDQAAIDRLQKISPVAWQSILFLGQYLFRGPRQTINVDGLIATAILP